MIGINKTRRKIIQSQRGNVLITCLLITATVFMLVISVSQILQLGWRQVSHQWQTSMQQSTLMLAMNSLARQPEKWLNQPCAHPPLTASDTLLQNAQYWRTLTPCHMSFLQQSIQWTVESLGPPQSTYRISAKLGAFMQQLTVTVDQQGQVRRQAWRNMI